MGILNGQGSFTFAISLFANILLFGIILSQENNAIIPDAAAVTTTAAATATPEEPKSAKASSADIVYGHVHMAKTAGTEINGELAARFERVCGHKGYSYDFHAYNERNEAWVHENPQKPLGPANTYPDLITQSQKGSPSGQFSRGRVPMHIMMEIGFHDCDLVSLEMGFKRWGDVQRQISPNRLELHVPCRDHLDHFLSYCNYRNHQYDCSIDDSQIPAEVEKCVLFLDRFSNEQGFLANTTTLKCFNPIPIENYIDYMSDKLQEKRIVSSYVHRETNKPRDKSKECLRTDESMRNKVKQYLIETFPIFSFCDTCMGSKDDLLASGGPP